MDAYIRISIQPTFLNHYDREDDVAGELMYT